MKKSKPKNAVEKLDSNKLLKEVDEIVEYFADRLNRASWSQDMGMVNVRSTIQNLVYYSARAVADGGDNPQQAFYYWSDVKKNAFALKRVISLDKVSIVKFDEVNIVKKLEKIIIEADKLAKKTKKDYQKQQKQEKKDYKEYLELWDKAQSAGRAARRKSKK